MIFLKLGTLFAYIIYRLNNNIKSTIKKSKRLESELKMTNENLDKLTKDELNSVYSNLLDIFKLHIYSRFFGKELSLKS